MGNGLSMKWKASTQQTRQVSFERGSPIAILTLSHKKFRRTLSSLKTDLLFVKEGFCEGFFLAIREGIVNQKHRWKRCFCTNRSLRALTIVLGRELFSCKGAFAALSHS